MFDPITTALIRSAPAFDGLDLQGLPKRLTHAFADIVSARIRLRAASETGEREELVHALEELRRVAAAQEAYVALLPERENRAAAAFVAASAHQACMMSRSTENASSHVDAASLSPEVCSTLLFLVAEAHADAAEAAKRIVPDSDVGNPVEAVLLQAIRNLAQGNLIAVVRPEMPSLTERDASARALQALQLLLLRGVRRLAAQLRARVDRSPDEGGAESSASIFLRCKALCSETIDGILDTGDTVVSLYPGPLHLANLLLAVEHDLLETALTRTPTPPGVPENGWWHVIRRMARQRPFLWRNHRQAIEKGYLGEGVSSAISFPTGGGKSTLAELKIASALLRQGKVVFLAPTHALVGQTARSLKRTFQNFDVMGDIDEDLTFSAAIELPEVTVTTPERCLMLLSIQPDAFAGLKLIVFDECHLLHPREEDRSRRGLDAMLTLLNLTKIAPDADLLLLSAMMKNTVEIASWIASLTGRDCLPLDLAWKPTRQVRGCVVYPADQIATLNDQLTQARRAHPNQVSTPAAVKRELMARPFGLFGLLQTWSTTNREDYSLLPLLRDPQLLSTSTGRRWYLTPNGNHVSSAIAAASASAGMKTLVFLQTTVFCESCVKVFPVETSKRSVTLTKEESAWRTVAVEEMGGAEYCYLQLNTDGSLKTGAASHHSLLLREERDLHESLFKRRDGIDVLFATSTLAQGMNLPSEVVIISGDSRFDPGADKMKKLEAHELLNAAGRAGRAGEGAQGFVLLVPSRVIDLDDEGNKINAHWMQLQAIFEQADQCLVIDDPLTNVLDQIQNGTTKTGTTAYLLGKLPVSIGTGDENDPAATLLNRSFAVFRAKAAGDLGWVQSRLRTALAARPRVDLPEEGKWIEQVGSATGLSIDTLQQILDLADTGHLNGTSLDVVTALIAWLTTKPSILMDMVRPESLEGLFGEKYRKLPNDEQRSIQALSAIKKLLPLWMAGVPLCDIEAAHLEKSKQLGKCEYARHFASRVVPDLAFLAGLPAQLLTTRAKSGGNTSQPLSTVLATLAGTVREGCDSPEALATRINAERGVSRVAARKIYDKLRAYTPLGSPYEDFEITRQRMRAAAAVLSFTAITL